MPPPTAGFEPQTPASELPQTHVLDRTASGIGNGITYVILLIYGPWGYHEMYINNYTILFYICIRHVR
jgi:hypothetical protein